MLGLMQDRPLLIQQLIDHAALNHGDTEIVSRTVEGGIHRYTYRDAQHRARRRSPRRCSALGIKPGDRIGTLAWNGYRHFELYYGVSGMGAVCHTINPRLFPEQIVYIVNHAEDQLLFVDLNFLPLVEKLLPQFKTVRHVVAMTDRAHLPAGLQDPQPAGLRGADRRQARHLRLAGVRRAHRLVALLHLGHDRQSEGRALSPPLDRAACLRRGAARHARPLGALGRSCRWCRCSTSTPGACPTPRRWSAPSWSSRASRSTAPACTSCSRRRASPSPPACRPCGWRCCNHLQANKLKLSTVKYAVIGGSAAPPAMIETFDREYGVEVLHAWGMTEMSPLGTVNHPKAKHARPAARRSSSPSASSRAAPPFGVDMKIVDDAGKELPRDGKAFGDLLVRGPWITSGYFKGEGGDVLRRRTAGSPPATSRPSIPTATCRSPTAPRT